MSVLNCLECTNLQSVSLFWFIYVSIFCLFTACACCLLELAMLTPIQFFKFDGYWPFLDPLLTPSSTKSVGVTAVGMSMTVSLNTNGVGLDSTLSTPSLAAAAAIGLPAAAAAAANATAASTGVDSSHNNNMTAANGATFKIDLWIDLDVQWSPLTVHN